MDSPIVGDELGVLSTFAVVADERSFTKAAVKLGVSRSAVSHSIRALEERLGLRLLARTTRSVAPTDAGERLLEQLRPALSGIAAALSDAGRLRDTPAGVVRLIAPPIVLATLQPQAGEIRPRLPRCRARRHERRRHARRPGRGPLRRRHSPRRVHPTRHGRGQGDRRAARGDRGGARVLRLASEADDSASLTAHRCLRYRMGAFGPVYGGSSRGGASRSRCPSPGLSSSTTPSS